MVTVHIPIVLRRYTNGQDKVEAAGRTLRQVVEDLERQWPGLKAELVEDGDIRPGLAIAVNDDLTTEGLPQQVPEGAEILILSAIGGGGTS
jgi:molybdopterin converting factor small subunit